MKQLSQNWYLDGNAYPSRVRNIRSSIITSHCLILIMHFKKNYNLPLISTIITNDA